MARKLRRMVDTMNANAKRWVEALESGEYKQTTGNLRKGDGFCCLGVACDLSGLGKWVSNPSIPIKEYETTYKEDTILPEIVKEWLGMRSHSGYIEGYLESVPTSLAFLNDQGKSFLELAKVIKDYESELFEETK